jgi:TetR/AcrR family transcriptional regulator, mexJK operon transcriptional repressor
VVELDTRRLILREAERLFMQHGYAAVSMSQIVEEISKTRPLTMPAIYYYYPTKEALYAAVILDVGERVGHVIQQAAATPGDLTTRVHAVAGALGQMRPERFTRMQLDMNEHLHQETRQQAYHMFLTLIVAPVVQVFADASASGELSPHVQPEVAASALMVLIAGLSGSEESMGPPLSPHAVASLLLEGIRAR